jgi:prephenate dehydrogenase
MRTLAIIGVGLIGGSIALAARSRGVAQRIIGVGRNKEVLEQVKQRGMLDAWHTEMAPAVRDADAVIVCTPVDKVVDHVCEIARAVRPDTWITDAGSTKATIVNTLAERLDAGARFVGSHPLAGSEKSGPQYADAKLFEHRVVVLTPHHHFHPDGLVWACEFWQSLGARIKEMTPQEHDKALSITSHLPHLVAAALAAMLPAELRELAASGFRDTTRVAGGDPALWTAICQQNQEGLRHALERFVQSIAGCNGKLNGLDLDHIHHLLVEGKRNRDALGS